MAALAHLSALLPLPDEELAQILDYAATLSPDAAAEHFSALLGDSPAVIEFISTFNSRRRQPNPAAAASSSSSASSAATPQSYAAASKPQPTPRAEENVPRRKGKGKKQKPDLGAPQARKVDNVAFGGGTVYQKKDHDDYIPQKPTPPPAATSSSTPVITSTAPTPATSNKPSPNLAPQPGSQPMSRASSGQGYLISDGPRKPKSAASSNPPSRTSTPKPAATKINITGGVPMKGGASTALSDLDAAIRALEMSTNPSQAADPATRRCNCVASRHPLQKAAPNCTSCGKVICVKEGLGPCTFCGAPLLSTGEVQELIRELRDERGREKQAMHNEAQRRAESSRAAPSYSKPRTGPGIALGPTPAEEASRSAALAHRDKLLAFQADNAQRTTIRDEAADFDVTLALAGKGGMWGTKEERAKELRRQQEILREMEWNQKPEWEKRTQVLSIDVVGGKVVRRMAKMDMPEAAPLPDPGPSVTVEGDSGDNGTTTTGKGLGQNPLMGSPIRPVYKTESGDNSSTEAGASAQKKTGARGWRRVQDFDDDEAVAGLEVGGGGNSRGDEPECG